MKNKCGKSVLEWIALASGRRGTGGSSFVPVAKTVPEMESSRM